MYNFRKGKQKDCEMLYVSKAVSVLKNQVELEQWLQLCSVIIQAA